MNKISPLQLAALMLCGRCVSVMSYTPFNIENTTILIVATLISTAIQCALIMPLVFFQQKFPSDNPCTLALSKNKTAGIIVTILYLLFFMTAAFLLIGDFVYLMDFYLSNFLPRLAIVAIMVLAALYIGKMNVSVFGKTGSFVLIIFTIFTIIILLSVEKDFYADNLYIAGDNFSASVKTEIKNEIARNRMLVMLVFLLPDLKGSAARCGFTYLGIKLVLLEVILTFITVILGDFAMYSKLPFFYLAAYSKTQIVERYDAVFMALWVFMSLLKLGMYFHCSVRCLKMVIPKLPKIWAIIITAAVPAWFSLRILLKHRWETLSHYSGSMIYLILLVTIIPLIMLFIRKGNGKINEKP